LHQIKDALGRNARTDCPDSILNIIFERLTNELLNG
jgi:hypothetical protein